MTARPRPEREIRPGIAVRDAEDAIAAAGAYRRGSLNAARRVARRVTAQGNGAGFITALNDAGLDTLAAAVGGLALAVSAVLGEVPAERRAAIRAQLATWALDVAARGSP